MQEPSQWWTPQKSWAFKDFPESRVQRWNPYRWKRWSLKQEEVGKHLTHKAVLPWTIDSWPQKPWTKVSQATLYLLQPPLLSAPFKGPKCCSLTGPSKRSHISSGFSTEERSQHRNIYLSPQNSTFFQGQHLPFFPSLRAPGWRTCLRSQPIAASYLSGLCDWFRNSHVT